MKKLYFIIFLFVSLYSASQTWPQPGAVWHYKTNSPFVSGYKVGSTEFKVTNTITINSQVCSQIVRTFTGVVGASSNPSTIITYSPDYFVYSNTNVYYIYNAQDNIFDTLVDLNANVGAKWRIPIEHGCDSNDCVTVLATGTVMINSITLKTLTVNVNTYFGDYTQVLVERMAGFDKQFYPQSICVTDVWTDFFACYQDNNFLLYQKPGVYSCYFDMNLKENEKLNSIYPSPNPFNDQLIINSQLKDFTIDRLEIVNSLGQKVFSSKQQKVNEPIQVDLPKGIYILNLEVDGHVRSFKVIK